MAPRFAAVVTAEEAGFYKPRPEPYRAVLTQLGTAPARTLFVAGSAADVPGARASACRSTGTIAWGCPARDGATPDFVETSLRPLLELV